MPDFTKLGMDLAEGNVAKRVRSSSDDENAEFADPDFDETLETDVLPRQRAIQRRHDLALALSWIPQPLRRLFRQAHAKGGR